MSVLLAPDMKPPADVLTDRSSRYLARVDAVLKTLWPDSAKITFLEKQHKAWIDAYSEFICTEGRSEPGIVADDPPHATDFLLTISGLTARIENIRNPLPVRGLRDLLDKAGR